MESLNFNSNGPVTGTGPIFIRFRNTQGGEFNSPLEIGSGSGTCPMSVGPEGGTGPVFLNNGGDSISDEALYLRGVSNGSGIVLATSFSDTQVSPRLMGGAQGGGIIKKNHGIDISVVGSTTGYLPMVTGNDPCANQNSSGTGTDTLNILAGGSQTGGFGSSSKGVYGGGIVEKLTIH